MWRAVDTTSRDWLRFTRQAVDFHVRNAQAWANAQAGIDLAIQIDPDFVRFSLTPLLKMDTTSSNGSAAGAGPDP